MMKSKESALLNKIYRAVHDGVCPNCGNNIDGDDFTGYGCHSCKFSVSGREIIELREVVSEWGQEAVEAFHAWRAKHGSK